MRNKVNVYRRAKNKDRLIEILQQMPLVVKSEDGKFPQVFVGSMIGGNRDYYMSIEGDSNVKVTDDSRCHLSKSHKDQETPVVTYRHLVNGRELTYTFYINPPSISLFNL